MNVLFVEDEYTASLGLTALLNGEGHRVDSARTFDKSLQLLQKNSYDLIIIDLMIPRVKGADANGLGKELILKLRAGDLEGIATDRSVSAVAITAYFHYLNVESSLRNCENTLVLEKPISPEDALRQIKNFMTKPSAV